MRCRADGLLPCPVWQRAPARAAGRPARCRPLPARSTDSTGRPGCACWWRGGSPLSAAPAARTDASTNATRAGLRAAASLLVEVEPHAAIAFRIIRPAFTHLDEQEQVHRGADDLGDLAPRLGADRLDPLPALAQHDLALALARHIDRLLDPHR